MQTMKKVHLLHFLLLPLYFFPSSTIGHQTPRFCGKIRIEAPLFHQDETESSPLNHMLLCKSQKLYFRTSLGLFPISSIDYTNKLLTISHSSSCSSSSSFVSPSLLSAGFPSPPDHPNSLALFDCSSTPSHAYQVVHNCTSFHGCKGSNGKATSCLLVNDIENLDKGFHPKGLNCSGYSRVYRKSSDLVDHDHNLQGYELGTRISFDIPNHVPTVCDECAKPHGNCGVGLMCICHPKACKNKVISHSVAIDPFGNYILLSLLFSICVVVIFKDCSS